MYKSTLNIARRLSSLRLTFAGMAALLVGVLVSYFNQQQTVLWIALPLLVLSLNMLCAIIYRQRMRQNSGLLIFHLCLLMLALLAAGSQLDSMRGHVEIVQGQMFDSSQVSVTKQGPLHSLQQLAQVVFLQGGFTVDYKPGLRRGDTQSELHLGDGSRASVGDTVMFKQSGYRFYTTSNKGYAAIIRWHQYGGTETGAINFPSFPLYDWKQENHWLTPSGQRLDLSLKHHDIVQPDSHWTLGDGQLPISLIISVGDGSNRELSAGQSLLIGDAKLEFIETRMWVGYSIFYNPYLQWMLTFALVGVLALSWHFYLRFSSVKEPVFTANLKEPPRATASK